MPEYKFTPEKTPLPKNNLPKFGAKTSAIDSARIKTKAEIEAEQSATVTLLEQSRYDETIPPPVSPAVACLGDTEVIWKGNVHTLVAGSKVGKSRFLAALIKSMVTGERSLGWSENKGGAKVIYLDFEQDQEDFYDSMHNQAGVTKDEVYAFNLAGVSAVKAGECVEMALKMYPDAAILLMDGVADLCNNVNDPEEANTLIANLMAQAKKYDTAILGVLHLNPGSDAKSRGHLGSQLERKSKTVLQINEKDGVRTVFTKLARKKPIHEKDGIRFQWSVTEGNFVEMMETKSQEKKRYEAEELREMMEDILDGRLEKSFTNKELRKEIMDHTNLSESTSKTRIRKLRDYKIMIVKDSLYHLQQKV